jgi:hypothetical protein
MRIKKMVAAMILLTERNVATIHQSSTLKTGTSGEKKAKGKDQLKARCKTRGFEKNEEMKHWKTKNK